MDMDSQKVIFRLGRRPAKQGPRPLLNDQDRVGKLATGRNRKLQLELSEDRKEQSIQLRKKLRIGTWNVRSMSQLGKTQILGRELDRNGVSVCGLSEVRWEGRGHFTTLEGHTIVYSGDKVRGQQGVAMWLHKRVAGTLIGYEPTNSRLMVVRINARPRCISFIQVYAPTSGAEEETVEQFYQELAETVKRVPRKDILLVAGDFNAKVGGTRIAPVVGSDEIGDINEAGERLLDFCLNHELLLANTWFKHHPRRLYIWTSPEGVTRNQIDYIGISQRWRSCINNCKTYPGADCDSDHNLLVATMKIRLGKKKQLNILPRLNTKALVEEKAMEYKVEVENRFEALQVLHDERTPEELWKETKEILLDVAKETVGFKQTVRRKPWISDNTFDIIKEKREAKQKDPSRYKELKRQAQKSLRRDKQKQLDDVCDV